jgi:hypothetical protein
MGETEAAVVGCRLLRALGATDVELSGSSSASLNVGRGVCSREGSDGVGVGNGTGFPNLCGSRVRVPKGTGAGTDHLTRKTRMYP